MSKPNKGSLYVAATPIGNLSDISTRLKDTLESVDLIAAEDSRVTQKLLNHLGIQTPIFTLETHREKTATTALLKRLENGETIALVSDAGTPCISDPGQLLVQSCHKKEIKVSPIPGPSALSSLLSISGLSSTHCNFIGFLPKKDKEKRELLRQLNGSIACFESPKRIINTLKQLQDLDINEICIAKELSKRHETLWTEIQQCIEDLEAEPSRQKGEWALAFTKTEPDPEQVDLNWVRELKAKGLSFKHIQDIAKRFSPAARKDLYKRYNEENLT